MPDISKARTGSPADSRTRQASARHYLMCPPVYFDVSYSINPWMDVTKPVDPALALAQWERLRDLYRDLGHQVSEMTAVDGLPDMLFTANGATVVDGRVLLANFRYEERMPESDAHRAWFRANGFRHIYQAAWTNEGEGDCLLAGDRLLCGTGFRTDRYSHGEVQELFGRPVIGLTLVDPRFYHLDTALAILDQDQIMYYPAAFSADSRHRLTELYPDAVLATDQDAAVFGLNAVCDGRTVVMSAQATELADRLRERGYEPIGVELSELLKAGGSAKCCTLELRGKQVTQ